MKKNTVELANSHGSYLNINGVDHLDFWSFYSSVPLGYNHPMCDAFKVIVKDVVGLKFGMGHGLVTDLEEEASKRLLDTASEFDTVWFAASGSLAIENAYRVAYYATGKARVLTDRYAFHGIHGLSNCFSSPDERLLFSDCPSVQRVDMNVPIQEMDPALAGVLIEPFRSLHGDHTELDVNVLKRYRQYCDSVGIPLIFDEIQTGFGATGSMWYYQKLGVVPDVLVFGKKAQVAGMMVNKKYSWVVHDSPELFNATFNGDLLDLVRLVCVRSVIDSEKLLDRVNRQSEIMKREVNDMRGVGYLLAYPVEDADEQLRKHRIRDKFLANRTADDELIKIRPNLALTADEMDEAISIMKGVE